MCLSSIYSEAVETRHALNGVRWPASNPKVLLVEFSSEAAIQKAVASTAGDGVALGASAATAALGKANEAALRDRSATADERRVRFRLLPRVLPQIDGSLINKFCLFVQREPVRTVREWDLGKREPVEEGGVGRDRREGSQLDGARPKDAAAAAERKRSSASPGKI